MPGRARDWSEIRHDACVVPGPGRRRRARRVGVACLTGHGGVVYGVAFSLDAALLATASADQTARLWA